MRKHPLRVAAILTFVAVFVRPGNTCGPFFFEDVFVRQADPDNPYSKFLDGRIGVFDGQYRVRHLVVAYNMLSGRGLSPAEKKAATDAEGYYYGDTSDATVTAAPWERKVPGEDYETFPNCLVEAQATAERTRNDLVARYGNSADVANWEAGQDAVFSNCEGPGRMPDPAPVTAPLWLRQDRAYQIAAAQFYSLDYDAALASFGAIAADHDSPWAPMARYLVARTLIRKATLSYQPFVPTQGATPQQMQAQAAEQMAVVRAGLTQARDQLQAILKDPAMQSMRGASSRLLDYVMVRLDPTAQADVLARRLTGPKQSDSAAYMQDIIDLTYIYNSPPSYSPFTPYKKDQAQTAAQPQAPLIRWMSDMGKPWPRLGGELTPANAASYHAGLGADALASWQQTHETQWLVAALDLAKPGEAENAALVAAAKTIPADSPASASVTYQRLRLEAAPAIGAESVSAGTQPVYDEISKLMPGMEKNQPRSTINMFADLQSSMAPTLADYVKDATRIAVGYGSPDLGTDDEELPNASVTLCGVQVNADDTRHFDEETALIFNERMPLSLLKDAALMTSLPANTRFELAHMAWTRAVLLDAPDIAHALTPYLSACQPAFAPWLKQYDEAKTPDERHVLGLLALMRFTSTEPVVRAGLERDFAVYDELRDNWWCSMDGQPVYQQPPPPVPPHLFSLKLVPRATQPDPPFLTAGDRSEANKEIARLQQIPCASDYFAREALAWVKAHPANAHDADVIGFAMRAVRNACRSTNTPDLNHQLFDVIHQQFPKSEWAAKYTTWE